MTNKYFENSSGMFRSFILYYVTLLIKATPNT